MSALSRALETISDLAVRGHLRRPARRFDQPLQLSDIGSGSPAALRTPFSRPSITEILTRRQHERGFRPAHHHAGGWPRVASAVCDRRPLGALHSLSLSRIADWPQSPPGSTTRGRIGSAALSECSLPLQAPRHGPATASRRWSVCPVVVGFPHSHLRIAG